MSSRPHRASAAPTVRRLLEQAMSAARARRAAVLARITTTENAPDFEGLTRRGLAEGRPIAAWRDAARGAAFLAFDRVDGASSVDAVGARAALESVQSRIIEADDALAGGPLAVFGLPFDHTTSHWNQSDWATWPRGAVVVPALTWSCSGRGEHWTRTAHVPVTPGDRDVEALLARWGADPRPLVAVDRAWRGEPRPAEAHAAWCARVTTAAERCRAGHLRKVVLARAAHLAAGPDERLDAAATFRALAARAGGATTFALSFGGGDAFVGATPETLAVVDGRRVTTGALAGTAPRSADPAEDAALGEALLHSRKDHGEHQAVVDGIGEALRPLCTLLGGDTRPRLRRLPAVQHLETRFEGHLRPGLDLLSVVAALHPTPALGGTPTPDACAWLRATEPLDRRQYAAPLGWLGPRGDGVAVVGIRAALIRPEAAVAFAGAGIVADSDPEAEWRETALKLTPIREALRAVPS